MANKSEIAFKGAAILGAVMSIPRVRHWVGELMVKANENLGIPQTRADIDLDTDATADDAEV